MLLSFILKFFLLLIVLIIIVYTCRHYIFTLNRLFGKQHHLYVNVDTANWPSVTVLVPAHNEEEVIVHCLEALRDVHYPRDKLKLVVVNDRSKDKTQEIIDDFVARHPGVIIPIHRDGDSIPGKGAILREISEWIDTDLLLVFDADYIPGRGLIKQLTAPFFDPEVGTVMGRVVPVNIASNLLTRLLDMERAAGYQVDQQARVNMGLMPQYGGTVGGVRMAALRSVGGWIDNTLTEDTDLTYRTSLKGWKCIYQNRSECYEEVPENWNVRKRQISRWAQGHNKCLIRYAPWCFRNQYSDFWQRLDGLLLLGVYMMAPLTLVGWIIAITLFYMGDQNFIYGPLAVLAVAMYGTIGNFAVFFQVATAMCLDNKRRRIRLLPLNFINFLISMLTVSKATFTQFLTSDYQFNWEKTQRFRKTNFNVSS